MESIFRDLTEKIDSTNYMMTNIEIHIFGVMSCQCQVAKNLQHRRIFCHVFLKIPFQAVL